MSDLELRECNYLSNCSKYDNDEIDWSFFAIFSNVIEKLNGGVSYGW